MLTRSIKFYLWLLIASLSINLSAKAELIVNISTNYYFVTGTNMFQIMDSIRANRPWTTNSDFSAFTKWVIGWDTRAEPTDVGFKIGYLKVTVNITITMPSFKPANGVSNNVLYQWKEYYKRLLEHEIGHARIARSAGEQVHKKLQNLGVFPTRQLLYATVNKTAESTVDEFKKKDMEYDKKTRHGMEQIFRR